MTKESDETKEYEVLAYMEIPKDMKISDAYELFRKKIINNELELKTREVSVENQFVFDLNKNAIYASNGYLETPETINEAKESFKYEIEHVKDFFYSIIVDGVEKMFNPEFEEVSSLDADHGTFTLNI